VDCFVIIMNTKTSKHFFMNTWSNVCATVTEVWNSPFDWGQQCGDQGVCLYVRRFRLKGSW
jgi:hypothetical protein